MSQAPPTPPPPTRPPPVVSDQLEKREPEPVSRETHIAFILLFGIMLYVVIAMMRVSMSTPTQWMLSLVIGILQPAFYLFVIMYILCRNEYLAGQRSPLIRLPFLLLSLAVAPTVFFNALLRIFFADTLWGYVLGCLTSFAVIFYFMAEPVPDDCLPVIPSDEAIMAAFDYASQFPHLGGGGGGGGGFHRAIARAASSELSSGASWTQRTFGGGTHHVEAHHPPPPPPPQKPLPQHTERELKEVLRRLNRIHRNVVTQ